MNREKIYFVSDIHLGLDRKKNGRKRKKIFTDFLKSLPDDTKELILLGDIFDFWYEWNYVVPSFHFDLFYELKNLMNRGVKVTYLAGNHDFSQGEYLKKEIGINCVSDSLEAEYSGKKFWMYHGDGVARSDRGYRIMKKLLRSGISNFLFRTFIHPDLGVLLAKMTSKTSRKHRNKNKLRLRKGEYLEFAESKFGEGFDIVVMGHRHYPEMISTEKGIYVNTGDWMTHFSYGVFDGKEMKIGKYYDAKQNKTV